MPRIRTIKPEFFTDGLMAQLPPETRIFYIGTWCFALCDNGHLPADPEGLGYQILPRNHFGSNPFELVNELLRIGRLELRETTESRPYLRIVRFRDHQKVDARWTPRCPFCKAESEGLTTLRTSQNLPEPPRYSPESSGGSGSHREARRVSRETQRVHSVTETDTTEPPRNSGETRPGKERKGTTTPTTGTTVTNGRVYGARTVATLFQAALNCTKEEAEKLKQRMHETTDVKSPLPFARHLIEQGAPQEWLQELREEARKLEMETEIRRLKLGADHSCRHGERGGYYINQLTGKTLCGHPDCEKQARQK